MHFDFSCSRLCFLSHRLSFGVYFPHDKREALIAGDMSGKLIERFYVHFSHLAGCQFYQELRGGYNLLQIQASHLRLTLEALGSMREEDDPFSFARAHFFLGMAHAYTQGFRQARHYYRIAMDIIRRHGIRFVTMSTGGAVKNLMEPLEEVHERAGILAHMVYLANHIYLLGKPDFNMAFHMDEDFNKSELPVRISCFIMLLADILCQRLYSDIFCNDDGDPTRREISWDLENQFRDELPVRIPLCSQILK